MRARARSTRRGAAHAPGTRPPSNCTINRETKITKMMKTRARVPLSPSCFSVRGDSRHGGASITAPLRSHSGPVDGIIDDGTYRGRMDGEPVRYGRSGNTMKRARGSEKSRARRYGIKETNKRENGVDTRVLFMSGDLKDKRDLKTT